MLVGTEPKQITDKSKTVRKKTERFLLHLTSKDLYFSKPERTWIVEVEDDLLNLGIRYWKSKKLSGCPINI